MTTLGLTPRQHAAIDRQLVAGRTTTATTGSIPDADAGEQLLRVLAPTQPSYTPGTPLECPVFEFDDSAGRVTAIYFTGSGLRGNVLITVDGSELPVIDVRSTEDELRAHVADALPDHVVSVWPGFWEFDGRGVDAVTINVEAEEPPDEPPPTFVSFDGGIQVVSEVWALAKVETDDGPVQQTAEIVDALPYTAGTVAVSAIGLCMLHELAGWIPIAWQCREVSYYSESEDD